MLSRNEKRGTHPEVWLHTGVIKIYRRPGKTATGEDNHTNAQEEDPTENPSSSNLTLSLEATYHYDILDVLSYKHSRYRQLYERCRSLPTHLDLDYLTPRPIKRPPHHDYLLFSLSLPSGTTDNTNASVPYPDEIKMTSVGWQSKIPLRSITLRKFFCLAWQLIVRRVPSKIFCGPN